mmetsp:Transcript_16538/g.46684  ORF Transcript_16538/g.46684 Transcript_16538/m.46684 type:complete len:166 (-) Transcript_16538:1021-1518(-)
MSVEVHKKFLRMAIELSRRAVQAGNHPFGALLVRNEQVVMEAENSVCTEHDITRHAELNLVSRASKKLSQEVLSECTLYTSTEPCAMCSGGIYWAGIRRVVFSCSEHRLGEIVREKQAASGAVREMGDKDGGLDVECRTILGKHCTSIVGPLLQDEAEKVHMDYW